MTTALRNALDAYLSNTNAFTDPDVMRHASIVAVSMAREQIARDTTLIAALSQMRAYVRHADHADCTDSRCGCGLTGLLLDIDKLLNSPTD